MNWLEGIEFNPHIIVVNEHEYRGIKCRHVEKFGWKIVLGDEEYLFPNWQEAKLAVDRMHENIIKEYGGLKLKK